LGFRYSSKNYLAIFQASPIQSTVAERVNWFGERVSTPRLIDKIEKIAQIFFSQLIKFIFGVIAKMTLLATILSIIMRTYNVWYNGCVERVANSYLGKKYLENKRYKNRISWFEKLLGATCGSPDVCWVVLVLGDEIISWVEVRCLIRFF
jgi:hypothetical protein